MTEIKPVYQRIINGKYEDISESLYVELKKTRAMTRILYPAAAYEALQKENERLDFQFKQHWCSTRGLLQKYCAQNAAQVKRIVDLEETLNYYKNMVGA